VQVWIGFRVFAVNIQARNHVVSINNAFFCNGFGVSNAHKKVVGFRILETPPDLYQAERPRHGRRQHHVFCTRDPGFAGERENLNAFGDFSVTGFTMIGLSEPRSIRGGVVGGSIST
jgi:hypothetical protein